MKWLKLNIQLQGTLHGFKERVLRPELEERRKEPLEDRRGHEAAGLSSAAKELRKSSWRTWDHSARCFPELEAMSPDRTMKCQGHRERHAPSTKQKTIAFKVQKAS